MTIKLPVRVNHQYKVLGTNEIDAGWAVLECESREEVLRIMREYPRAAMPCWRRVNEPGCFGLPKGVV
jgi:hypothetical protein